jgi:transcriptional regulator with PAS, ATPase and Fis domain
MSHQDMSTSIRPTTQSTQRHVHRSVFLLTGARTIHPIDGPLLVGRSNECDIAIPTDLASSRIHLQIVPSDDAVRIVDRDSSNGTFVDGRRVDGAVTVREGIVRFGDSVMRIAPSYDEEPATPGSPLIGGGALGACRRIVSLIAPTDLPLLVTGETGTGKEVVARWAHECSHRRGPLIPVNCAALPESLFEAELFGHARGAFTGASHASRGLVVAAASGTLFLDEVGELPFAMQAKLLRLLEDRIVRPIGGDGGTEVDFRVISATNVDLRAAVERGRFRADLFARLAAVEIAMPPLRSHVEDMPAMIDHLLSRAGSTATISIDALEAMARYSWPQNVRQLDHSLRRAAALSATRIDLEHLPEEVRHGFRNTERSPTAVKTGEITRETLENTMRQHRGNVRKVGQSLGIPRSRMYRLLARFEIDPDTYRDGTAIAETRDSRS